MLERRMSHSADFNAAMKFVLTRIEEESARSGEPLSEDERWLLHNLPTRSGLPRTSIGDPRFPIAPVPRDSNYERLIALAKSAHRRDRELAPESRDWKFAISVFKLDRHPMGWLLEGAGIKQPKPWWDRCLIIIAAVPLAAIASVLFIFVASTGSRLLGIFLGGGFFALTLAAWLASRKLDERELRRSIENCRAASRFGNLLSNSSAARSVI
jgi:hypothetical protein